MVHLIFDYDGTLHNSIKIYAPAFRTAYEYLVTHGKAQDQSWSDEEISRWLGYSSKDMWEAFMPGLSQELKDHCSQMIGANMQSYIKEGKAELYPDAIQVLQELKEQGYNLIFLSNCKEAYMNSHIEQFHLEEYFSAFYCSESFDFRPKYEIFNTIAKNHRGVFMVIGDRFQDMEIAQKHELKAIGCEYGYGKTEELQAATVNIQNLAQLPEVIKELVN